VTSVLKRIPGSRLRFNDLHRPTLARRDKDGLNVNVQLVRVGAAAPYFYEGRRGRYAALLERLALRARAKKVGLWGRYPHTPYDPTKGVSTRR
jgi:endonuclease YncB( thermonuclease family)